MSVRQRCLLAILLFISSVCSSYTYDKLEEFKYNQNILLTGIVSGIPKLQDDQYEFIFHSYKYGDILLKAAKSYRHYLIPANKLEIEAKIYKPHEYDNLAAFNYAEYLEHNDIIALGRVIDNSAIAYKGTASLYLPERIRYYLYNYLQNHLRDYKQKDFAIALLIGDKNFNQSQQNLLISSGTSHLMVISGLHVGLLALIAFIIFRGLWSLSPRLCRKLPAQYIGVIASVIIAFIYSLLAGFSLPTQRALIMLLVVAMLWLFGKRISIVKSLLVAFVIILLLDFESIYSISLWLSFSAVILLVIISIALQQYRSKLAKILLAQTYLAIFLVPISVYYFGGFSIVSILANIIAIPLVSFFIVPLLFLSLLLSFIGIKLWLLPMFFLKFLVAYLSFLTNYAGFISYWSYFSFFSLVITVLGIILVIFPFSKSLRILGLAMCLVFFQSSQNNAEKYQRFQIDIFDTQDQMVLVQDEGKNLLYTAAKNLANEYLLVNILESYLRFTGIKQIDYLIIVDGNKNLNLKLIRQITTIKTVITNISTNEDVQKCSYANNFKLNNHSSVKLLSNAQSCFISLNYQGKEFLLADNSNQNAQQQLYILYNRVIKPQIIITSAIIDSKFLNQDIDYLVYISNKPLKRQNYQNTKLKIFDTYANGLITIKIDNHHSITISSQLKQY
ncbi:ComEC/Rec2 family competence protein [Francisella hispaniensis]|uniref:ComEC/Rec2 family competence protein n=1 Tax=Francisella hispaniensis TaxID=622488 RepID=UPI0019082E37|nr:ComEC/Rec2 family competence protein [Francisella hispaniensis]MBK2356310.1 ComEC/Rec2 family competence protein [Francisella hispaniensis]